MIIDTKEMKYKRLKMKNLDQQFQLRIEKGMGCSPFVSKAILNAVHETYFEFLTSPDYFSPGKIKYQCISKKESPITPIAKAELVTVTLTIDAGESDLMIRKDYGIKKLRHERITRICAEAYHQGGVLTVEDLAYKILNVGERTLVRDLKEIRDAGMNPPLRSTMKDMGRTISHKGLIVQKWLKGDELSDLQRKYNHSLSAIENYINIFKRIIFLSHEGKKDEQIAYILKVSEPLVATYLSIWQKYGKTALKHRKKEILELIRDDNKSKKKKDWE